MYPSKKEKTTKTLILPGEKKKRLVYVGSRGGLYVKKNGVFIRVKKQIGGFGCQTPDCTDSSTQSKSAALTEKDKQQAMCQANTIRSSHFTKYIFQMPSIRQKNVTIQFPLLVKDKYILEKWLSDVSNYIRYLPYKDLHTLMGYTHTGDVLCNTYLRNLFDKDLFSASLKKWKEDVTDVTNISKSFINSYYEFNYPLYAHAYCKHYEKETVSIEEAQKNYDEFAKTIANKRDIDTFWIPVLQEYIDSLQQIIDKSPPLPSEIILYRGFKDDMHLGLFHNPDVMIEGFLSTSSDLTIADSFKQSRDISCCIQEIVVPKGKKVIPLMSISMFPRECEFLFGKDMKIHFSSKRKESGTFYYRSMII